MTASAALRLGARNFVRNLYRYRFLASAVIFIVAAFTVIVGAVSGMGAALEAKATRYFSGHVTVQQVFMSSYPSIPSPDAALGAARDAAGLDALLTLRSVYYDAGQAELFFGGRSQRQRRLIGVDWDLERGLLSGLDFVLGSPPASDEPDAVIVSTIAAEALGLDLGDELVIRLSLPGGAVNSGVFVVRGVYRESSFFGYSSYLQRAALNRLMSLDEQAVSELGVFLSRPADARRVGQALARSLAELGPGFPAFDERADRDEALAAGGWSDGSYLVMTVRAQLAELNNLLSALWLIAGLLLILFAGLVVIGVSNTYAFLVLERTAEIGAMRAVGMRREAVAALFMAESLCLALGGVSLGILAGVSVLEWARRGLDLSGVDLASLFLEGGRLRWVLEQYQAASIAGLGLLSVVLGCVKAAIKASRLSPADALRSPR